MKSTTKYPDANDPGPSDIQLASMRQLDVGTKIRRGDWIDDISEWADGSDTHARVGREFLVVWRKKQ